MRLNKVNVNDFCIKTDIGRTSFYNYLNGDRVPKSDLVQRIINIYDIPEDMIYTLRPANKKSCNKCREKDLKIRDLLEKIKKLEKALDKK